MLKTFKEELVAANYSEAEINNILEKLGAASVGLTLERLQAILPTEKQTELQQLSEEERVRAILRQTESLVSKKDFEKMQTEARQELIDDFVKKKLRI